MNSFSRTLFSLVSILPYSQLHYSLFIWERQLLVQLDQRRWVDGWGRLHALGDELADGVVERREVDVAIHLETLGELLLAKHDVLLNGELTEAQLLHHLVAQCLHLGVADVDVQCAAHAAPRWEAVVAIQHTAELRLEEEGRILPVVEPDIVSLQIKDSATALAVSGITKVGRERVADVDDVLEGLPLVEVAAEDVLRAGEVLRIWTMLHAAVSTRHHEVAELEVTKDVPMRVDLGDLRGVLLTEEVRRSVHVGRQLHRLVDEHEVLEVVEDVRREDQAVGPVVQVVVADDEENRDAERVEAAAALDGVVEGPHIDGVAVLEEVTEERDVRRLLLLDDTDEPVDVLKIIEIMLV